MKKIALLLSFILCAFFSFAQFPNNQSVSNDITLYTVKGALFGGKSVMIPVIDTLNNLATPYRGALTVRPQDSLLYMSDGVNWHPFVSSTNGWIVDSIYVERPLAVKIGTSGAATGKQVIYFLKESGLIAGGIPFSTGCRTLTMPPTIYIINYNQYTSLATALTIDTSHATLNRTDRIVGDTFGVITVLKGTPSSLGLPPPFNPSSQFSLALVSIPAASGCVPNTGKVVYDENVGVAGGEYDPTTVGAIAVDFDNTDNPYHLTKAAFISTYVDSSQIVFTNTGLQDTVTSTSTLVLPTYLNNQLTNPIQVEFFLNTTSVSNNTVINSYLNSLDTGQYQVAVIPFQALGFNSNYFNKIVFTFRGWDTSGAAGLYFDWIRIQKGITTFDFTRYVDSVSSVNVPGRLTYYKAGIAYDGGAVGSTYTASQGLILSGSDFRLGNTTTGTAPTFTTNRFINTQTFKLQLDGTTGSRMQINSSSTGVGLNVATESGDAIRASTSNGGIGLNVGNDGLGVPVQITTSSSGDVRLINMIGTYTSTNTVVPLIVAQRLSNSAAAIELGASIDFRLGGASGGAIQDASRIITKWTTVAGSNFGSQLEFWNAKTATRRRNMAITEDGGQIWDQYTSGGSFYRNDSTTYKPVVIDATGNVFRGNWSGGGGGSTNSNIGAGYRLAVPGTNNIKTLFAGTNITLDSAANADGITINASGSAITPAALTKTDDTNVTLTLGGTPTTALLQATSLTLGWTGNLAATRGGTGTATVTTGDLLYGSGTNTWSKLPIGTTGQKLVVVGGLPVWRDTTAAAAASDWSLTGNSGTSSSTNFIGTIDSVDLVFRAYNFIAARLGIATNTVFGYKGIPLTATGVLNTGMGQFSLQAVTSGSNNTASGYSSLGSNTTGSFNSAFGYTALFGNTSGTYNTAMGWQALKNNTTGINNVAIGPNALGGGINTGSDIVAIGRDAGMINTSGANNVFIGYATGQSTATGGNNTFVGFAAGSSTTSSGNQNTAYGAQAGRSNTTGSYNIWIGKYSGAAVAAADNKLYINSESAEANRQMIYGDGVTDQVQINSETTPALTTSAQFEVISTTRGFLPPRMTTTQMNAISSPATGLTLYNTTAGTNYVYNGSAYTSVGVISGSFSGVGTATTVFTVTFGNTQPNATYKVIVTPTAALSAALFYVTNKTTTTFDVTYLAGLTGTVTFDWAIHQ